MLKESEKINVKVHIEVSAEGRKEIQEYYKCHRVTVSCALNYDERYNNELGRKIRYYAMKFCRGIKIVEAPVSDVLIWCEEAEMYVQKFPNGYTLISDKSGRIEVYTHENLPIYLKDDSKISDLYDMQAYCKAQKGSLQNVIA